MSTNATNIYLQVVEDVIKNVKEDLENEGLDENVLTELQTLWELKLMQATSAGGNPTAKINQPPNLAHGYRPGQPTNLNAFAKNHQETPNFGQPQPYMVKPEPWSNYDMNRAFPLDGSNPYKGQNRLVQETDPKRRRVDINSEPLLLPELSAGDKRSTVTQSSMASASISQNQNQKIKQSVAPAKLKGPPKARRDDDSTLSSDDEDDDDTAGYLKNDEDPKTKNLVLGMYDKVTRVKNKWKCVLKDCIFHLNGRDFLAAKVSGEFDF